MTTIYLVWTGYEDVEAAFRDREDAERCITDYIRDHPTFAGRLRTRDEFSITEIELR